VGKLQRYQLVEDRPSRIQRFKQALDAFRSHWSGPLSASSPEIARLFNATPVSSGVAVNETTALNYSAVWAAVGLISSQVGNLPCPLWRKLPGGGKERYTSHPLYRIVHDRPNPEMSAFTFRETLQAHVLTWGNAYAEIERNGADRVAALWPITPDRVMPFRRSADSPLQYRVQQPNGGEVFMASADMLHIPGLGFDGVSGYSVIQKARESIGLGLATERFGGSFFGNGATFGGVISYKGPRPTELSDKNYTESLNAKHQGVDRAHKLLALYNDATYTRMGIPPNDAQFLESRTFQIDEVARWFNLPPHKLKELARSTNNNIEHQNLEYYIDCLSPWLERWDQELNEKLVSPLERNQQEIEFVAAGLLRGDSAGRGVFYREQFNTASIIPNEIREIENRNPVDGGDEAFVNTAMIPLSLSKDWWQASIDEKLANIEKLKEPPPRPPGPTQEDLSRAIEERDAARKKAQEFEDLLDISLGDVKMMTTQRDDAVQKVGGLETALRGETTRADGLNIELVSIRAAVTTLELRRAGLEADVQRVGGELQAMTRERDTARDQHATEQARLTAEAMRLGQDLGRAVADLSAMITERDGLSGKCQTVEAVNVELRAQIITLTGERDDERLIYGQMREARVLAETAQVQTEAARLALDETLTVRTAALAQAERRLNESGVAIRAALVDDLRWLIEHESDRARRVQGSPDKLRTWLTQFYPGHEDRCRKVLRPSVRAWVVCMGHTEPVEYLLDLFVAEYINQSRRQLGTVADEHDADTMAPALEQVLRRWEAERAETIAARVLKEVA
jgi:HK97 family phage portal protein